MVGAYLIPDRKSDYQFRIWALGAGSWGRSAVPHWAVANTWPQAEDRALSNLIRQGFTCYAPREREIVVSRGRKVTRERYLFPRYLFVRIEQQWHSILGTFGISRVLMDGERPGRIPDRVVLDLQISEVNGAIELPRRSRAIGDRVEIIGGPFDGLRGMYQGMTARQREVVLLEKLGRVELASGCLQ